MHRQNRNLLWTDRCEEKNKSFGIVAGKFICIEWVTEATLDDIEQIKSKCPELVNLVLETEWFIDWLVYSWKFGCWQCEKDK
jgi:hypothetical protein